MDYEGLRHFADTWGLLVLGLLFVVIILFLFRRGSTERYRRAARIPMDAPERPAPSDQAMNEMPSGGPAAADEGAGQAETDAQQDGDRNAGEPARKGASNGDVRNG